jgi:hypothetical protein
MNLYIFLSKIGCTMSDSVEQILLDTLFNLNVRTKTRQAVLESALESLNLKTEDFMAALQLAAKNPENVEDDQRERDRSAQSSEQSLVERELKWMSGEASA